MTTKLVRDKIPEIIEAEGRKAVYTLATPKQMPWHLLAKMREELDELEDALNNKSETEVASEAADLTTAMLYFLEYMGLQEEMEEFLHKKLDERGGFSRGVILQLK